MGSTACASSYSCLVLQVPQGQLCLLMPPTKGPRKQTPHMQYKIFFMLYSDLLFLPELIPGKRTLSGGSCFPQHEVNMQTYFPSQCGLNPLGFLLDPFVWNMAGHGQW
jgi:hypothetical protein